MIVKPVHELSEASLKPIRETGISDRKPVQKRFLGCHLGVLVVTACGEVMR